MMTTTILAVVALVLQGSPSVADSRSNTAEVKPLSVRGDARLTAAQLKGWYAATRRTPRLTSGITIGDLARLYVQEGNAEHIRGDVAFAQAILETGYFTFPRAGQARSSDNNFAGLGACDTCTTAARFPTARDGVRAQIQLLRVYVDNSVHTTALANTPTPSPSGSETTHTASTFDQVARGHETTLESLGNGQWASAAKYGTTILAIYRSMLSFAATKQIRHLSGPEPAVLAEGSARSIG